jgi:TM2 domain-containing membrane protein YozV
MGQKVWVISDQDWNGAPDRQRRDSPPPGQRPQGDRTLPAAPGKNPALSFSCAMLVWGSGHLYLGERRRGFVYLAAMVLFYAFVAAPVLLRDSVSRLVVASGIPTPVYLAGAAVLFLAGQLVWLVNAVDAYYRALRPRSASFPGVDHALWPLCGSLVFPGWGQFLNGQPGKGLFFLLCGAAGVFSVVICCAARYVWPLLKASPARLDFEFLVVAMLALIPLSLLMGIVAAYDAFRSCRERCRKKWRLKNAGYRAGGQAFVRDLIPRGTAILGLLLAISVGVQCFPKNYYLQSLEKARLEMLNNGMQVLPELVRKAMGYLGR